MNLSLRALWFLSGFFLEPNVTLGVFVSFPVICFCSDGGASPLHFLGKLSSIRLLPMQHPPIELGALSIHPARPIWTSSLLTFSLALPLSCTWPSDAPASFCSDRAICKASPGSSEAPAAFLQPAPFPFLFFVFRCYSRLWWIACKFSPFFFFRSFPSFPSFALYSLKMESYHPLLPSDLWVPIDKDGHEYINTSLSRN